MPTAPPPLPHTHSRSAAELPPASPPGHLQRDIRRGRRLPDRPRAALRCRHLRRRHRQRQDLRPLRCWELLHRRQRLHRLPHRLCCRLGGRHCPGQLRRVPRRHLLCRRQLRLHSLRCRYLPKLKLRRRLLRNLVSTAGRETGFLGRSGGDGLSLSFASVAALKPCLPPSSPRLPAAPPIRGAGTRGVLPASDA